MTPIRESNLLLSQSETYSEVQTRAGLPNLHQQRLQNTAIFMFKVKIGLVPTYITEIFNTAPKRYNLSNSDFNILRFGTVHYGKKVSMYNILGPITRTKNKVIDKILILRVLKQYYGAKTNHA